MGLADETKCPDAFIPWKKFIHTKSNKNPPQRAEPADVGLLAYTGGTTGRSKGVYHTQRSCFMNLHAHVIESGLGENECMLLSTPLAHSAGLLAQTALLRGATIIIEEKFDAVRILETIEKERVTCTFMVPTMIYRVLDQL